MQKTNSSPEAKAELDRLEALKKRAARQASKRELAPETVSTVECVVLPQGDGKISMGEHIGGLGTVHYEEGERFPCLLPNAILLYERGYVNFEGAREAIAASRKDSMAQEAADAAAKRAQDRAMEQAGL